MVSTMIIYESLKPLGNVMFQLQNYVLKLRICLVTIKFLQISYQAPYLIF